MFIDTLNVHGYILKINFGNLGLLLGVMSMFGLFLLLNGGYKKTLILLALSQSQQ
jgi:hypothetical protein